ncbi:hypothetical protein [Litchfieldia salsa]|uniref:Uncharacterized protein n=1 Tax=Litchfieldia salsa TaxID=930152 RepID=A0A1H0X0X7_9BACI|nr:hypothetical protein [Litchfieldia salsa]SDP96608.1 hypothetical protein SAMN05216565_12212 [Litchfieldia salsa]
MNGATAVFFMEIQEIQKLNEGLVSKAYYIEDVLDNLVQVSVPISWIDGEFYEETDFLGIAGVNLKKWVS